MLIKKTPNISGLVTPTVLNTKIGDVKRKISDFNGLVTTTVFNRKIGKYFDRKIGL